MFKLSLSRLLIPHSICTVDAYVFFQINFPFGNRGILAVDGTDICNEGVLNHYLIPDPVICSLNSFVRFKLELSKTLFIFTEKKKLKGLISLILYF